MEKTSNEQGQAQQSATAPPPVTSKPGSALLGDPVREMNYGAGNAAIDPNLLNRPLEEPAQPISNVSDEPDIFKKAIKEAKASKSTQSGTTAPGGAAPPPRPSKGLDSYISNPALSGLPEEERMRAADNLAKLLLFGYGKGKSFLDKRLQISERKVLRLVASGKVDLDAPIPMPGSMTRYIPFNEFVQLWNMQLAGTIKMDPAWRAEVEPILIRVLAKHGAGLSDEAQLATMFISDMMMTGQQMWAQKQNMDAFLAFGAEMTKMSRAGQVAAAPPPEQPTQPVYPPNYTPPPPPPETYSDPGGEPNRVYSEAPPAGGGIAEEQQLPTWGKKDIMRNLKRVSKKNKIINSADPGRRARIKTVKK